MKLKQINGEEFEIDLSNPIIKAHFDDPKNFAEVIINEFNAMPFRGYIEPTDKIILDIGANVGLFAAIVAPYAERIVCVEPTPEHMAVQKELLKDFDLEHEQSALLNYTGKCGLFREGWNTTMNRVSEGRDVNCITLLDLCKKYDLSHIDLCKVDIEGGEFAALTVETIKPVSEIIDRFMVEVHPLTRESQNHFIKIFNECGYWAKYMDYNAGIFAYK